MQVILQPAGKGAPTVHYQDTITNRVPVSRVKPFVTPQQFSDLIRIYSAGGSAAIWGVTPGKDGRNQKRWERMEVGDIAFFAKEGRIFSTGVVAYKMHNKSLAVELWKTNADAETWEYVYFLESMRDMDI